MNRKNRKIFRSEKKLDQSKIKVLESGQGKMILEVYSVRYTYIRTNGTTICESIMVPQGAFPPSQWIKDGVNDFLKEHWQARLSL